MEKLIEKLELVIESFVSELKDKPIITIIKAMIVIWLIKKAKTLLK